MKKHTIVLRITPKMIIITEYPTDLGDILEKSRPAPVIENKKV